MNRSKLSRGLSVEALEDRRVLAVFAVTRVDDALKDNGNPRTGTLRWAIEEANVAVNVDDVPDEIAFDIPAAEANAFGAFTIRPDSGLPEITDDVIINGATQPGFAGTPLVEINGDKLVTGDPLGNGLKVTGGLDGSTIAELSIFNFPAGGVDFSGQDGNILSGSFIGVRAGGSVAGNDGHGLKIVDSDDNVVVSSVIAGNLSGVRIVDGSRNTIGIPTNGNIITRNAQDGVAVLEDVGTATGNIISSNVLNRNGGLPIDLGNDGKTDNDAGDIDTGANDLQNKPVIAAAVTDGGQIAVALSVDTGEAPLAIEIYDARTGTPLASAVYTALGGIQQFVLPIAGIAPGTQIAATSTNGFGSTSELSDRIAVGLPAGLASALDAVFAE